MLRSSGRFVPPPWKTLTLNTRRNFSDSVVPPHLPRPLASSFTFWPTFLSAREQAVLLHASLQRLDAMDSVPMQRKRRKHLASYPVQANSGDLQTYFASDDLYDFHEGHFDGVIHHYREMHVSAWPEGIDGLSDILKRLLYLCPTRQVQTHILHLASYGDILPHVDNLEASGSFIMGVSLGDERVLHMESPQIESHSPEPFDLLLPSGSVYLQRDTARYTYKHSILRRQNTVPPVGQRLSVMFRVREALPLIYDTSNPSTRTSRRTKRSRLSPCDDIFKYAHR
ncbi:hypothetical protein BKA70DRAFT_1176270 [Coprinopsis sp. MPI-PUGE-AT-0042]|nr:hypothetical protein BKA70DRAFT_1176270 [Coprinopsis sp. MPI-PUGE-AT-0042]